MLPLLFDPPALTAFLPSLRWYTLGVEKSRLIKPDEGLFVLVLALDLGARSAVSRLTTELRPEVELVAAENFSDPDTLREST